MCRVWNNFEDSTKTLRRNGITRNISKIWLPNSYKSHSEIFECCYKSNYNYRVHHRVGLVANKPHTHSAIHIIQLLEWCIQPIRNRSQFNVCTYGRFVNTLLPKNIIGYITLITHWPFTLLLRNLIFSIFQYLPFLFAHYAICLRNNV